MFDIGFPELMIVSIVALLVIGPEKLPETVRTIALWVGRIKRSLANIKLELENEIGADEIRQQLRNEGIMKELSDAKQNLDGIMQEANTAVSDIKKSTRIDPATLKPGPRPPEPTNDGTKQIDSGG